MDQHSQFASLLEGSGDKRRISLDKAYARIDAPIDGLRGSQIVEVVRTFPDQNETIFRTSVGRVTKTISTNYASPETGKLRIAADFGPFKQGDLLVSFDEAPLEGENTLKMYNAIGANAFVPTELLVSPYVTVQKKPKSPVRFKDYSNYAMILQFHNNLKPSQVVAVLSKSVSSDGTTPTISCITPRGTTEAEVPVNDRMLILSRAKYRLARDAEGLKKGALLLQFEVSRIVSGRILLYTMHGKSVWVTSDMVKPWSK